MFLIGYTAGFLFNCEYLIREYPYLVHHWTISSLCQLLVFWHQTKLSQSKIAKFQSVSFWLLWTALQFSLYRFTFASSSRDHNDIHVYIHLHVYMSHVFGELSKSRIYFKKKYIHTTHQSSMCIQKGTTFCFGSGFSNTHQGPFTSFPHGLPRPEPMAQWVDEAMALCMPLCGIAKEAFAVKNGNWKSMSKWN